MCQMYLKVEYKVSMYMAVLYKHAVEFDIVGTVYHLVIYIYIYAVESVSCVFINF